MFSNVPRISSDGKVKCKAIPVPSIPSTHTDIKPLPRLYQSLANIVLPSPHLQNYTTMPPKRTAEDMGSSDEHHMSPSSRPRIENSDDSRGSQGNIPSPGHSPGEGAGPSKNKSGSSKSKKSSRKKAFVPPETADLLVEFYANNPAFYDKEDQYYSNNVVKLELLNGISEVVGLPVSTITTWYTSQRRYYNEHCKKLAKSGSAARKPTEHAQWIVIFFCLFRWAYPTKDHTYYKTIC